MGASFSALQFSLSKMGITGNLSYSEFGWCKDGSNRGAGICGQILHCQAEWSWCFPVQVQRLNPEITVFHEQYYNTLHATASRLQRPGNPFSSKDPGEITWHWSTQLAEISVIGGLVNKS